MNIFIDTNIYLEFFHLSKEDLEELRKVFVLQKTSKVKILLTEQVKDEFRRNRESKIKDAIKQFGEDVLNERIPQMAKAFPEYHQLIEAKENFKKTKSALLNILREHIANETLVADDLIRQIFELAEILPFNHEIFQKALIRHKRGNPPGKPDSMGDAISWETLLAKFPLKDSFIKPNPERNDLHLISDDPDWFGAWESNEPHKMLAQEWSEKAEGNLFTYKRISSFMSKHFPQIKFATELEKEIAIERLRRSSNYQNTHRAIEHLSSLSDYSKLQINEIVNAYLTNSQVYWIIGDEDVLGFALDLIENHADVINPPNLKILVNMLPGVAEDENLKKRSEDAKTRYGTKLAELLNQDTCPF